MHFPKTNLEVCVDSFDAALAAANAGAGRIELCSALSEGGLTPSYALIKKTCREAGIMVHVMIRPRGGDFVYTDTEFEVMQEEIYDSRKAGAHGLVFGILNPDGSVDVNRCSQLMDLCRPRVATFHRAFDMCSDPFLALEEIISLGFDYLLTSGLRQTAEDGLDMIRELVKRAGDRIRIIAGSGVNAHNVKLLSSAGVNEFHFTARKSVMSPSQFRNEALASMGSSVQHGGEYSRYVFDEEKIRSIIQALQ